MIRQSQKFIDHNDNPLIAAIGIRFLEASTENVSVVARAHNKTYRSLGAATKGEMAFKKLHPVINKAICDPKRAGRPAGHRRGTRAARAPRRWRFSWLPQMCSAHLKNLMAAVKSGLIMTLVYGPWLVFPGSISAVPCRTL